MTLTLDQVLRFARQIALDSGCENFQQPDDVTARKYAKVLHLGCLQARGELDRLVATGRLLKVLKQNKSGGAGAVTYQPVGDWPLTLEERCRQIDAWLEESMIGDPDWLQPTDITIERWRKEYGGDPSTVRKLLHKMAEAGSFSMREVRCRRESGLRTAYRPTPEFLERQEQSDAK